MFRKKQIALGLALALGLTAQAGAAVTPQSYVEGTGGDWTWNIDAATYSTTGYIKFNDWGYKGPTGLGVNDYVVTSPVSGVTGYDPSRPGQVQTVTTVPADWRTPDPAKDVVYDTFYPGTPYPNANMDGNVNFYKWAYTTPTSVFADMRIDKAGNYLVYEDSMSFGFYDTFDYNAGGVGDPVTTVDTNINFQPYAITDAFGWCGSVLTPDPNALMEMAGQVAFDFAFDAYLFDGVRGVDLPSTQIVPGFVMRSYGEYEVNVTTLGGIEQKYFGSAVGNNMNPDTVISGAGPDGIPGTPDDVVPNGGEIAPEAWNLVSFLGAGVVPNGVWVSADSFEADGLTRILKPNGDWNVTVVPEGTPGAIYHNNDFGGFAFLLRADAQRVVTWYDVNGFSDYPTTVPVPAAVWLFGSGLLGLMGVARRRGEKSC